MNRKGQKLTPAMLASLQSPSVMSTASIYDKTMMDSPSKINLDGILPAGQRYDYSFSIKSGIKKKKVKASYDPKTAPYIEPNQDKSEMDFDDSKIQEGASIKSGGSKRADDADKKSVPEEIETLSKAKVGFIFGSTIFALAVGIGCFGAAIVFCLRPFEK